MSGIEKYEDSGDCCIKKETINKDWEKGKCSCSVARIIWCDYCVKQSYEIYDPNADMDRRL